MVALKVGLNPSAPQRYSVAIEKAGESIAATPIKQGGKNLSLPLRIPVGLSAGSGVVHASFTFVYCREDNTGTCRIKTLVWRVPVEVVGDANAGGEIRLSSSVNTN